MRSELHTEPAMDDYLCWVEYATMALEYGLTITTAELSKPISDVCDVVGHEFGVSPGSMRNLALYL